MEIDRKIECSKVLKRYLTFKAVKYIISFFSVFYVLISIVNAQQVAYTPDGNKVFLNEDGTWRFENVGAVGEVEREEVSVVKKYLAALSWEDRLGQVRNPDKVKSLMAERYTNYQGPADYENIYPYKRYDQDGTTQVRVVFSSDHVTDYYLVKTDEGYKVDWMASIPISDMSLAQFKAEMPTTPTKFAVFGKLSSSVDEDKKEYWCIALYDSESEPFWERAYIKRDSQNGQKLFDILKDGEQYKFVMKLKYFDDSSSFLPYVIIIDDVISFKTWVEK